MQNALILFVRNPELGKVKTRLAATIGNQKTLLIYNILLKHTRTITEGLEATAFVFYNDAIHPNDIWNGYNKVTQHGNTLGEKMENAFAYTFAKGYTNVAIIGSDCYDLTTAILTNAFTQLQTNNVVIGPANDGGYYLLGMQQLYPTLLANKAWSTPTVYNATIANCKALQLTIHTLPTLVDIDDITDLEQTRLIELV